jgi:cyclic-di-GMP phosphodiesterase, flagellum assembly factor TipF
MRRLTLALLCATYLCLSLIVALALWRNGLGWGVAISSMMGCLGLCLASHGMIMRFLEMRELRGEVEAVRDAHRILLDQVVAISPSTAASPTSPGWSRPTSPAPRP